MSKLSANEFSMNELSTGQLYYQRHKERIKRLKARWQRENKDKVRIYQLRWRAKQHIKKPWYGQQKEMLFDSLGIDNFVPQTEISQYPDSICGYYSPDNLRWQRVCTGVFFIPLHEWTIG